MVAPPSAPVPSEDNDNDGEGGCSFDSKHNVLVPTLVAVLAENQVFFLQV
jgi:hypothetical protein